MSGQAAQTVTDPTNRWRFSGKETQSFYNPAIPYNDFGARLHDPRTGRCIVNPKREEVTRTTVPSMKETSLNFESRVQLESMEKLIIRK